MVDHEKPEAALFSKYGRQRWRQRCKRCADEECSEGRLETRRSPVHSLRHNMQDRMIVAGVSEHDRKLILGHSLAGEANRYGTDEARLVATTKAMLLTSG